MYGTAADPTAKPPHSNAGLPPIINPKDLSNEELEYIIKTGQLPPRFSYGKQSARNEELKKTNQQHPSLQSYIYS
jgi:hypothetical protein